MEPKELFPTICQNCYKNEGDAEGHYCSYHADIHNDSESMCNCCEECMENCANDI